MQLELFKTSTDMIDNFTNDDYETPDHIAQAMSKLVLPTDRNILEPFAGSGQIVKYLPGDRFIDFVEIKRSRYLESLEIQASRTSGFRSLNGSFFEFDNNDYDLIISNPPFSLIMEAIAHSLTLLNMSNPAARILFLIPLDTFSSVGRSQELKALDAHIHHTYLIPERIDYLKEGKPMSKCQKIIDGVPQFTKDGKPIMNSGRQVYDAIFDIRTGKNDPATTFLF